MFHALSDSHPAYIHMFWIIYLSIWPKERRAPLKVRGYRIPREIWSCAFESYILIHLKSSSQSASFLLENNDGLAWTVTLSGANQCAKIFRWSGDFEKLIKGSHSCLCTEVSFPLREHTNVKYLCPWTLAAVKTQVASTLVCKVIWNFSCSVHSHCSRCCPNLTIALNLVESKSI